jgi:hypothetical protein
MMIPEPFFRGKELGSVSSKRVANASSTTGALIAYLFLGPERETLAGALETSPEVLSLAEKIVEQAREALDLVTDGTPPLADPDAPSFARHYLSCRQGIHQFLHQRMENYEALLFQIGETPDERHQEGEWAAARERLRIILEPFESEIARVLKGRVEVLVGMGKVAESLRRAADLLEITLRPKVELDCGLLCRDLQSPSFVLITTPEQMQQAEEFFSYDMLLASLAYARGRAAMQEHERWSRALLDFMERIEAHTAAMLRLATEPRKSLDLRAVLIRALQYEHRVALAHRRLQWIRDRLETARIRLEAAWSLATVKDCGVVRSMEAVLHEAGGHVAGQLRRLEMILERIGHLFQALTVRSHLDLGPQAAEGAEPGKSTDENAEEPTEESLGLEP